MSGVVTLHGSLLQVPDVGCSGLNGYDDLGVGTAVTVYDQTGVIIGTDKLDPGKISESYTDPATLQLTGLCHFSFAVRGLPQRPFYQVEVSHRGKLTVQAGHLADVELTIGS